MLTSMLPANVRTLRGIKQVLQVIHIILDLIGCQVILIPLPTSTPLQTPLQSSALMIIMFVPVDSRRQADDLERQKE